MATTRILFVDPDTFSPEHPTIGWYADQDPHHEPHHEEVRSKAFGPFGTRAEAEAAGNRALVRLAVYRHEWTSLRDWIAGFEALADMSDADIEGIAHGH